MEWFCGVVDSVTQQAAALKAPVQVHTAGSLSTHTRDHLALVNIWEETIKKEHTGRVDDGLATFRV